ncbi:MAG TPA: RNA polymerase Rpb4 family protein [archaeon]|nr:RNA polymerase Rpb4 family protein [archaeon]HLD81500.1 RNA polymerase Rpb4 family protein [archaeon]
MIGKKLLGTRPVSVPEVNALLEEKLKGVEKPNFEQEATLKYVGKFSKTDAKKANKLKEALMEIEGVDETLACKFVDLMPEGVEDVRAVYAKGKAPADDVLAKIFEKVNSHKK